MLTKTVTEETVVTVAVDSAPECLAQELLKLPSSSSPVDVRIENGYIRMTYRRAC
jgi:hypothetical protein